MLIKTHRQESLSRTYIQAVAARCGMSCSFREFDYGIDVTLHEITRRNNRYVETGFNLDIQAKSTVNAHFEGEHVRYDMEVKTYEDLRDPAVGTPRILVMLALPTHENNWTEMTEEQLLIRKCAYWMSLRGLGETMNEETIRVSIPRANAFNVESLQTLMHRVRTGEDL